jgi:hypothetical protein
MIRTRFALLAGLVLALCLSGCTSEDPGQMSAKPVIYSIRRRTENSPVTLAYAGELTCVYPQWRTRLLDGERRAGWNPDPRPSARRQQLSRSGKASPMRSMIFPPALRGRSGNRRIFWKRAGPMGLTPRRPMILCQQAAPINPTLQIDCLPARTPIPTRSALHYTGAGEFAARSLGWEPRGSLVTFPPRRCRS